jgi:hypothetical protein
VGLERGPLSLVSTNEELLGRSSGFGQESRDYGRRDPLRWPHDTHYLQELILTSPPSGGHSVGIVRSRTKATELLVTLVWTYLLILVVDYRLLINWIIHQQLSGYKVEEIYIWETRTKVVVYHCIKQPTSTTGRSRPRAKCFTPINLLQAVLHTNEMSYQATNLTLFLLLFFRRPLTLAGIKPIFIQVGEWFLRIMEALMISCKLLGGHNLHTVLRQCVQSF